MLYGLLENQLSAVARESAPGANDTNPIANISDLNIEVAGEKNIGFLRLKDYSDNNTNDMILDSTTMGTFTFGNGAKNSSLVRTDKHGIQVKKDISITGKMLMEMTIQEVETQFYTQMGKLNILTT